MPNRDKTGPQGEGPRTGRGMGECGDKDSKRTPRRDGSSRDWGKEETAEETAEEREEIGIIKIFNQLVFIEPGASLNFTFTYDREQR